MDMMNAFTPTMRNELIEIFGEADLDDAVRAIVVTGAGKAFCAGGNLKWVLQHPSGTRAAFHELAGRFHQSIIEIRRIEKPVIAAVNGATARGRV